MLTVTSSVVDLTGASFQWQRHTTVGGTAFTNISGAIGSAYTVHPADIGRAIRVVVTLPNLSGTITSGSTANIPNPALTIIGTQQVQQMITITSLIIDLTGASYQWQRHTTVGGTEFTNISGAIGSAYTVHPADIGRAIRVIVTLQGLQGTIESNPTEVIPSPPTPTINGIPQVQQSLTVVSSALDLSGASFQWQHHTTVGGSEFTNISGATGSTFVVRPADIGRAIRAVVTLQGLQGTINSNQTVNIPNPTLTIDATPQVHQILSVTSNLDLTGATFQWQHHSILGGTTFTNIGTGSTFTVRPSDVGRAIRVNVTLQGLQGTITSNHSSIVPPLITGNPQIGQILTAVADVSGASLRWERNTTAGGSTFETISGETGSTFVVRPIDLGHIIRVVLTSGMLTVISNPTNAVIP
jgi:hypothetical protein